jgi:GT2 family glycosyltransferase
VFICPRSESFNVRQVPDGIWQSAAAKMDGTKFWLGRHPAPPGIVDLKASHFDHVLNWLSVADLLVSVDTGPMHVAAAFGVPIVAINQSSSPDLHLSDLCDFVSVSPDLPCLNCQVNVCPKNAHMPPCQQVDPDLIASWVNAKLRAQTRNGVSAVVAIYRPEVQTLNRCLDCLLPQVEEIIVTAEANSVLPAGHRTHDKIRYVRKNAAGIGYGRNANYGVRHSNHQWLLLLNDDVFIDPEAVQRLRSVVSPNTGVVTGLLRYGDGTIYHCGKRRSPGERGWGHLDYKKRDCTLSGVTEMENVNLACCLVRRKAFYEIGCFDEDYFMMAEDDDLSLRMRRHGWRLLVNPTSTGVHLEHASVSKIGDIMTTVQRANAIFDRKWRPYLLHNLHRIPFGNFDY